MIILDATTKSIQFKLTNSVTTNQLPFAASYVDTTGTATTPGEQDGASNNTTAVTVVSSPASSTQRLVKNIVIQNADTTAATVTIIYNNNSTLRNIIIVALAIGDQLTYEDGYGWAVIDKNGNFKTSASGGSGTVTTVSVVSANGFSGAVATATTTPAITLSTSISGILKGNGTAISAASAGTDYQAALGMGNLLPLNSGGTNANLTASNGGIFYSTSSAAAILAGTATANQMLLSGSSAAPSWSTSTIPASAGTSGNILTSDGTNWTSASPVVTASNTVTFTNKRITKRTGTTTSSATPTINTDNVDFYSLTAQAVNITSMTTNLSGTPTEGQTLWIAITGTAARTITWGSSFEASTVALPTTTVSTNRLDIGFVWNTVTSKWRCVATC